MAWETWARDDILTKMFSLLSGNSFPPEFAENYCYYYINSTNTNTDTDTVINRCTITRFPTRTARSPPRRRGRPSAPRTAPGGAERCAVPGADSGVRGHRAERTRQRKERAGRPAAGLGRGSGSHPSPPASLEDPAVSRLQGQRSCVLVWAHEREVGC